MHMSAIGLNVLALIALTLEAADYFSRQLNILQSNGYMSYGYDQRVHDLMLAQNFTFSAIWLVYGAALMAVGFWKKLALVRWQARVLIAFSIGKVFIWDTPAPDKN